LRGAEAAGDADPGTADDAEDLRQNQIAQSQAALKLLFAVGRTGLINVMNVAPWRRKVLCGSWVRVERSTQGSILQVAENYLNEGHGFSRAAKTCLR
jgi:hypothetical protein